MEVRTSQEARGNIEEFTTQLLVKLMEKKTIDADIKDLKEEFTAEGVPVGIVNSVISKIKADMKKTDSEKFELAEIGEWLESNPNIKNAIGKLIE
jgi:uncharacterized protein (UPF0335 family)